MAVPKASKMITDRQRQCEFVDWFVVNHREALVTALVLLFQQDLEEGEPAPDVMVFLSSLVRRLRRAFRELVETEQRHLGEIANDGIYRDRRDETVPAVREVVLFWRHAFRTAYGARKTEETGFERRISDQPLTLLRQSERILSNAKDPAFELVPAEGTQADREVLIRQLEPLVQQLRQFMDALTSELTKAHGTKVAKDQAMGHFDQVYRIFVNLVQPAFRLAGYHELAERLTLKVARRSDTTEAPEEPLPEPVTEPSAPADPEPQP